MVIVTTREGNKPGPQFLVDLRNGYIFMNEKDEWTHVSIKNRGRLALEPGKPFPIQDRFGLLEGLVVVDATQAYNGPHPEGAVRCSCGVIRNEDGFCPRCHDDQCHICNKPLTKGLCKDPKHNPLPVPHWRTKPMEGEPLPPRKSKTWPDKFKALLPAQKKRINDFFGNLMGVDRLDMANWQDECAIHRMPKFAYDFKEIRTYYRDDGPLK